MIRISSTNVSISEENIKIKGPNIHPNSVEEFEKKNAEFIFERQETAIKFFPNRHYPPEHSISIPSVNYILEETQIFGNTNVPGEDSSRQLGYESRPRFSHENPPRDYATQIDRYSAQNSQLRQNFKTGSGENFGFVHNSSNRSQFTKSALERTRMGALENKTSATSTEYQPKSILKRNSRYEDTNTRIQDQSPFSHDQPWTQGRHQPVEVGNNEMMEVQQKRLESEIGRRLEVQETYGSQEQRGYSRVGEIGPRLEELKRQGENGDSGSRKEERYGDRDELSYGENVDRGLSREDGNRRDESEEYGLFQLSQVK